MLLTKLTKVRDETLAVSWFRVTTNENTINWTLSNRMSANAPAGEIQIELGLGQTGRHRIVCRNKDGTSLAILLLSTVHPSCGRKSIALSWYVGRWRNEDRINRSLLHVVVMRTPGVSQIVSVTKLAIYWSKTFWHFALFSSSKHYRKLI